MHLDSIGEMGRPEMAYGGDPRPYRARRETLARTVAIWLLSQRNAREAERLPRVRPTPPFSDANERISPGRDIPNASSNDHP
jgi:hypothetical protein